VKYRNGNRFVKREATAARGKTRILAKRHRPPAAATPSVTAFTQLIPARAAPTIASEESEPALHAVEGEFGGSDFKSRAIWATISRFTKFDPETGRNGRPSRGNAGSNAAYEGNEPLGSTFPPKPAGAAQAALTRVPRHSA
jgi:hypothetical protein